MTQTKHTPTPWESGGCCVWQKNGDMIADLAPCMKNPNETEANAEFIVRCVNSHDALVEAIQYVFASGRPLLTRLAIEKMQKALAAAGEKAGA